jgi:hypothetical protein
MLQVGVGHIWRSTRSTIDVKPLGPALPGAVLSCKWLLPFLISNARGVGQYEHPVPDMRGANGGSRNAMPLSIIPDLGQRPENSVQSSSKQRCHVLQHNRSGLQFSNQANGLKEQSRPFPGQSCPSSGVGNILTRESADDAIDLFEVA